MPATSATSADKKREAMASRRRDAQRSAASRRRSRPERVKPAATPATAPVAASPAIPENPPAEEVLETAIEETTEQTVSASDDAEIDTLCELVETNPTALGSDTSSVRQLCRNRRKALSSKGKAAVPSRGRMAGRPSRSASGRELARMRRSSLCRNGRGDEPASRPSGRVRQKAVPPKVETGTTLAGSAITGTQVENQGAITGNESGTCRAITGTEYIGTEQFSTFCGTSPEPNAPKVGFSITSGGMQVSGTEVGPSAKVTGDEQGGCSSVTGSEYLGVEDFKEYCDSKGFNKRPEKVASSETRDKKISVTGSDEARQGMTTGNEAGAKHAITGSQYADTGAAKLTINGPSKVALTHTIAGRSVTGTEVGQSARVTGDEQGSCRAVSGTEYLSNEQFESVCQTHPVETPAKVGVDKTRNDQRITGNLLDRNEKVTGNEPGSCKHLTGSQYGQSSLCGGSPPKAHTMHTLSGRELSGNRVDHGPKLSGDDHGGCQPVTGTEYYGKEQFAESCNGTPQPAPEKVAVETTPGGQAVSGTMLSNTDNVTGNEAGTTLPVSGTPYSGVAIPETHGACCSSCAARQLAEAAGVLAANAMQTGMVENANMHAQPDQSRFPVHHAMPVVEQAAAEDFSISSPARAAQKMVTGSAIGGSERVTGPINMAQQLISGTPEFRYPQNISTQHAAANQAGQAQSSLFAESQQGGQQPATAETAQRVTGEGGEEGTNITGDNWARGNQVTGTEGRWAQGRNPTLRGEQRNMETGAYVNRTIERPEISTAEVTGSSGNCHEGALITVSGGARG